VASKNTQEAKPVEPGSELARVETGGDIAPVYERFTADDIRSAAIVQLDKMAAIVEVLKDKVLKKGTDFGLSDPRAGKDTLLKPGAEKLIQLFNTTVRFQPDNELHAQFGNPDTIAFMKCQIIDNVTGVVVGEGHGACRTGEQNRDENKAIKQAKKRAVVDACLYAFCLSEFFTQDMEAGAYTEKAALLDRKRSLIEQAEEYRMNTDTKLTASAWINELTKAIYQGRKTLYTIGECDEVFSQFANFDKASGVRTGGKAEELAPKSLPEPKAKPKAEDPKVLLKAKEDLLAVVKKARKDINNDLDDGKFVMMVAKSMFGRNKLLTVKECIQVEKALDNYNHRTGKKV